MLDPVLQFPVEVQHLGVSLESLLQVNRGEGVITLLIASMQASQVRLAYERPPFSNIDMPWPIYPMAQTMSESSYLISPHFHMFANFDWS